MIPAYIIAGFKTKQEALGHILTMFMTRPNCVGLDGTFQISGFGKTYVIKPKKSSEKK